MSYLVTGIFSVISITYNKHTLKNQILGYYHYKDSFKIGMGLSYMISILTPNSFENAHLKSAPV
jgi:hypothetical protein